MPASALIPAVLAVLLASQEEPVCRGDRVAMLPLEPLALAVDRARAEEDRVRHALSQLNGLCVLDRSSTMAALSGKPLPCPDRRCRTAAADALGADWVLDGIVAGLGGQTTLSLTLSDAGGERVSRLQPQSGSPLGPQLKALFARTRALPHPSAVASTGSRLRPVPFMLGGLALGSAITGGVFGLAARETANQLMRGTTGCPGSADEYQKCFASRDALGRRQATWANVLFATSAGLAAGAVLSWKVSIP